LPEKFAGTNTLAFSIPTVTMKEILITMTTVVIVSVLFSLVHEKMPGTNSLAFCYKITDIEIYIILTLIVGAIKLLLCHRHSVKISFAKKNSSFFQ
jgi:hypothetical protein